MAGDVSAINYIYPPAYNTAAPTGKHRRYSVHLTGVSTGVGESGEIKIDLSGLLDTNGKTPTKITIEKIEYEISGYNVQLSFDHTADVLIASLGMDGAVSSGCLDWTKQGGFVDPGSGGNGDVILTTSGEDSGDTYTIVIDFRVS